MGQYSDPRSKITYMLMNTRKMVSSDKTRLDIMKIYNNDTLSELFEIDNSEAYYQYADIKGIIEEGKLRILVTFVKYREKWNESCNLNETRGCLEIYYTESYNEGLNWTIPYKIQHENMTDSLQRISPQIVYSKIINQAYVFYALVPDDPPLASAQFAYAILPKRGQKVSPEIQLQFGIHASSIRPWFSVATTKRNNQYIMNLVYLEEENKLMYTKSDDLMNWSDPIEIAQSLNYTGYWWSPIPFMLISNEAQNEKDCLFLVFVGKNEKGYLRKSCGGLFNWTPEILIAKNNTEKVRGAICDPQSDFLLIISRGKGGLPFTIYDNKKNKAIFMQNAVSGWDNWPFLIRDPYITCYEYNKNSKIYAVKIGATTEEGDFVFVQNGRFVSGKVYLK